MQSAARRETEGLPINYEKAYIERVLIRLTAPQQPEENASGQALLHGYLCDIYRLRDKAPDFAQTIDYLCQKWNVIYLPK